MTWASIKIGKGGLIPRFDIANDGTMVCATDSFGGYVWSSSKDQWVQLLTSSAMPLSVTSDFLAGIDSDATGGFDDIIVDHSNSNSIWIMYHGKLYHSTNKGATFTLVTGWTAQPAGLTSDVNPMKQQGPYSNIDPNNSNILYFSTSAQGLYRSTDGGTSFSRVTDVGTALPSGKLTFATTISTCTNSVDSI